MSERAATLRDLTARLQKREDVMAAFLAKSFTDRLLILDVDGKLPDALRETLRERDLEPAAAVYGDGETVAAGLGSVGDATRHHFVDLRTRGTHQSYVVD